MYENELKTTIDELTEIGNKCRRLRIGWMKSNLSDTKERLSRLEKKVAVLGKKVAKLGA